MLLPPMKNKESFVALLFLLVAACSTPPPPPAPTPVVAQPAPTDFKVYKISQVDIPPLVREQARPHYPTSMRQSGIEGEVVVQLIVDTQGHTTHVEAVRFTDPAFVEPAVEAVRQWVFRAARKNKEKVGCLMQVPIVFTLSND